MKLGIPKESRSGETRVAAGIQAIKKITKKGFTVFLEGGAGVDAGFSDADLSLPGVELVDRETAFKADVVFKINPPNHDEIGLFNRNSLLLSLVEPFKGTGTMESLAAAGINCMGMELIPRTSRAQSMDVLSSQANIAGYRAVLEAFVHYPRFSSMMMTSAGMSKPSKAAVLGVGVAGLQAIATARRLGCNVEAYDVRPEVKEQILSLGAKCIAVDMGESGSGEGGYAKELSEDGKKRLQGQLQDKLQKFDVIITTANIPGRKAPVLLLEDTVKQMREGSVIVDMAAINGGNCPVSEADKIVHKHGVTIIGTSNFPALMPGDSSNFFANNLMNLLEIMVEKKDSGLEINYNLEDDIIAAALVTRNGEVRYQGK